MNHSAGPVADGCEPPHLRADSKATDISAVPTTWRRVIKVTAPLTMVRDELNVLAAFLIVAEKRSFTPAAKRLGVSQSALSHAIRGLEEQIGVRLLARTTRSPAPTDAGEELLTRLRHRCINFRHGAEGVYRWEFDKGQQSLTVAVKGPLIVDGLDLVIRAALDGVRLAFMSDDRAEPYLERGTLVRVLDDWCQPFPGFFIYYPGRRQQPAALAALVDTLGL